MVEAVDGGVMIESRDGRIWAITPDEMKRRTQDETEFRPYDHDEIAICNLAVLQPFTIGGNNMHFYEFPAMMALAAQHLNSGDGSVVADASGLPEWCNVRFALEFVDTELSMIDSEMIVA